MREKLRFGIVGLGSIAKTHAEVISSLDNAELVSAFHKNKEKADSFAASYGAKGYSDLDSFLSSGIDVLTVTTPSAVRCEYALPAMERGISVLLEKPMDVSPDKAKLMIETAERCGITLGVIFQNRFSPLNKEIRKAVESGRLGKRILSSAYVKWFRSQEYYDSGAWRGTKEIDGGGCLMNQAIHGLDLLLSLSSPLKDVLSFSALLNHERIDVEDTLVSSLRFSDGSLGGFECSTAAYPGSERRIELIGSSGTIIAEDDRIITWSFEKESSEDEEIRRRFSSSLSGPANSPAVALDNHRAQYVDFIDAILHGRRPAVDGREGLKSLLAVDAIYRSAESGKMVTLCS